MFKAGDKVRIKGYREGYDGTEGLLLRAPQFHVRPGEKGEIGHITVTYSPPNGLFSVGRREVAMYFGLFELVSNPEELICEDWS